MDKPTVNDCNVCAEDGWYNVKDDRIEPRETCPNCSGAGRVVGVPADSIVVADDTGRVVVVPMMTEEEIDDNYDGLDMSFAARVNLGLNRLDGASQPQEAPAPAAPTVEDVLEAAACYLRELQWPKTPTPFGEWKMSILHRARELAAQREEKTDG